MGWLGLTHEQPNDIDAFCEAKCDKNSPDFSNCMDSCFKALGGADLFHGIFLIFGCLGLFILLFIVLKQFKKFTYPTPPPQTPSMTTMTRMTAFLKLCLLSQCRC